MDVDTEAYEGWTLDLDPVEIDLGLDLDDGGDDLPPLDEPPRGERPRRGPPPRPVPEAPPSGAVLAVFMACLAAMASLQLVTISLGARGGWLAVGAVATGFAVLFLGPFVAGSIWLGRLRRGDAT